MIKWIRVELCETPLFALVNRCLIETDNLRIRGRARFPSQIEEIYAERIDIQPPIMEIIGCKNI